VHDVAIREYTAADEEALVDLSLRAWEPVFRSVEDVVGAEINRLLHGDDWRPYQEAQVRDVLARSGMRTWVAETADGALVGFAAATVVDPQRKIGELAMLAVAPDSQQQGLGTRLTEVATDWLRTQGMRVAYISTGGDVSHAPARRVYEKASYTLFPSAQYFKAL
jgi:GNAT superfamily N-acetyltransferase